MSNENGRVLASYIAHVLHVLVQAYLGLFLFLLIPPLIMSVSALHEWEPNSGVYRRILEAFPQFWTTIFGQISLAKSLAAVFLAYPIGFVFSECGYRFGKWSRYHDGLDVDEEGWSPKHFRLRCWLLGNPVQQRLWDWQHFQFNFCYYSELLLASFSLALGLVLIIPIIHFRSLGAVIGIPLIVATGVLSLSCLGYWLMRTARDAKLEDFRNAHAAIKELFQAQESAPPP